MADLNTRTRPHDDGVPMQGSYTVAARHQKKYHQCDCYGHPQGLPNYKILAQPRTNNYYLATGGCPCIPRAVAHPGSWRLKAAQLRSATQTHAVSCTKSRPDATCCVHAGETYGWKPGPHRVLAKNTAASGLCDTFGNMAFKKPTGVRDKDSDVSSVCQQKLEDLEALILDEHEARRNVEMDVDELKDIQQRGTHEDYRLDYFNEMKRKEASAASEAQLHDLLREVRAIVKRPLNQTNMDILRRVVDRQEYLMQLRARKANEDYPQIVYP
ncbi:hypothetical protein TCSYLVIO_002898 [Trypanosoma cruzi]|uniref:Uncharacterized protein n=2 Tax=Trypanosoma cruzi TaxID=5693 RepID=V5AJB0_TRYCR|nr:hypothetical protein TCSYLVIO_002898 [Trypanosoma cruzi]ESS60720.1 hypothetical protein TCDM_11736 [Trypanosoma cruzi Dm28c]PBJ74484.1 hypothetical protein BCY84_12499 [Trypanosoma cruzi cruzi]KAF8285225.1 hypothetical protein TcBrA4_0032820 [Trypanosoma cruzi]PWU83147.1 hypothetical protein C4B63_380g15 [Trypanosoma cruzi]